MRCCAVSAMVVLAIVLAIPHLAQGAQGPGEPSVGPRGPLGPDVPLSEAEKGKLAQRVAVEAKTAAAVQAACERAARDGTPVVYLPRGEYVFEAEVRVPRGLTLLGDGSATLIRTKAKDTRLFRVDGDRVRFTRLKLQGADTTPNEGNDTYGIHAEGKKDIRIDHCELLGFSYATDFADEATAQVDHCLIHHNLRDGLGYGVALYSGAYVLVTDNEFSQNRHSLASNGALDWSSPKRVGKYVHKPGVRKTHWEFIHNRIHGDDATRSRLCAVDTHPGMDGTFAVEANLFENLRHGVGIRDGSGLIRANLFRQLTGYRPVAISISYDTHNNIPVEGTMPHDIQVEGNVFDGQFEAGVVPAPAEHKLPARYRLGKAENITIDGTLLPETRKDRGAPPPIPWLQEMADDGILTWRPSRPLPKGGE